MGKSLASHRRLTRRAILAAPAISAAVSALASTARGGVPRVHLLQLPWSFARAGRKLEVDVRARVVLDDTAPALVVLPLAGRSRTAPTADRAWRDLGKIAAKLNVYLAGAVHVVTASNGAPHIHGFLIGPDGALLLAQPKVRPSLLQGYVDETTALDRAVDFAAVATPFGKIAVLTGEDIFQTTQARAAAFSGAELILNPALERGDAALDARRAALTAVAYHHTVYVASACANADPEDDDVPRATRTAFYDWTGTVAEANGHDPALSVPLDINRVRLARANSPSSTAEASRVTLPNVRDGLYGWAFGELAKSAAPRVPATRDEWLAEANRRIAAQAQRATPEDKLLPFYDVLMAQTPHVSVGKAPDRRAAIAANIKSSLAMVARPAQLPDSKLAMFPEFCFTGAGWRTVDDALSVCLTWPGPELELLAAFAQANKIYVAAQQLELDPKFPDRIFNTAFIFDDSGNLISRHRKLQCVDVIGTLPDTTPASLLDRYIAEYGADSLWHVVDTPLGKLAPMICWEMMYPEIRQVYTQKGADVFLHMTAEGYDPITDTRYAWNAARRQLAMDSTAYLCSVNKGDDPRIDDPWHAVGESMMIDPMGRINVMLHESKPGVLRGRVELEALRALRSDPLQNISIWDDPVSYAAAYQQGHAVANNLWTGDPKDFVYRDLSVYMATVARFYERGTFTAPST